MSPPVQVRMSPSLLYSYYASLSPNIQTDPATQAIVKEKLLELFSKEENPSLHRKVRVSAEPLPPTLEFGCVGFSLPVSGLFALVVAQHSSAA